MVMSWIWTGIAGISILFSFFNGNGSSLAAAIMTGAQAGVTLAISMSGSICLWTGAAAVMEAAGITGLLAHLLQPLLHRGFPSTRIFWGWATRQHRWGFNPPNGCAGAAPPPTSFVG